MRETSDAPGECGSRTLDLYVYSEIPVSASAIMSLEPVTMADRNGDEAHDYEFTT